MTLNDHELLRRIQSDLEDGCDEELELELEDLNVDALAAGLDGRRAKPEQEARRLYFRELFRLQREPVQLPPRVRHQDYVRHPVPASMIVPARY